MKVLAAFAILVTLLTFVNGQEPCFPCDPNWPRPIYYINYDDCNTFWECSGGSLTLTSCTDPGNVFDFFLQACVPDDGSMPFTCARLMGRNC